MDIRKIIYNIRIKKHIRFLKKDIAKGLGIKRKVLFGKGK